MLAFPLSHQLCGSRCLTLVLLSPLSVPSKELSPLASAHWASFMPSGLKTGPRQKGDFKRIFLDSYWPTLKLGARQRKFHIREQRKHCWLNLNYIIYESSASVLAVSLCYKRNHQMTISGSVCSWLHCEAARSGQEIISFPQGGHSVPSRWSVS